MTRKERLLATLRGEPVDRPPVSFYELNGLDERPDDPSPYNIYSHPSWRPLIDLTREKTDRIVMRYVGVSYAHDPIRELTRTESFTQADGTRNDLTEIRAGNRLLKSHRKREPDILTTWTVEHLLKDEDDLREWIALPEREGLRLDYAGILSAEEALGDSGIAMIDIGDALCEVAGLFSMEDFTVMALTEGALFERALEKAQRALLAVVERTARELSGRLWRVCGPEYAAPPYLPPALYRRYVLRYDRELVTAIQNHGGYARLHQHGRLKETLDMIAETGCVGLDPIEPPPQGDVSLAYVRQRYGEQLVLFGNLEASDLETLPPGQFEAKIITAMEEGMAGRGRGFVLMPSSCPFGRVLSGGAVENYQRMIEVVERYQY